MALARRRSSPNACLRRQLLRPKGTNNTNNRPPGISSSSLATLRPSGKNLLYRGPDNIGRTRIAAHDGRRVRSRLFKRDMRRKGRYVRVRIGIHHYRTISTKGKVPGSRKIIRLIDTNSVQADQFRIACIGEIGKILCLIKFRIAFGRPLFPRHQIQVAVIQYQYDQTWIAPAPPVFADRNEFIQPVHLHGAIASHGDDHPVRMSELGGNRIGNARIPWLRARLKAKPSSPGEALQSRAYQ